MLKIILSFFVATFLVACAYGTPKVIRGNSSSVEVWSAHMMELRQIADPIADQWCGQYKRDAVFIRIEHGQNYYYICNARSN